MKNKLLPILIGLFSVCLSIWISVTPNKFIHPVIEKLENLGYDIQLRTRILTHTEIPDKTILIVDIDDRSLQLEGHWPWPRSKMTELVKQLNKAGALIVSFDIFFAEKQPNIVEQMLAQLNKTSYLTSMCTASIKKTIPLFDEDATFAKTLKSIDALLALTFLPYKLVENQLPPPLMKLTDEQQRELDLESAQGYINNLPLFQDAAKGIGFINVTPDSDGIARHAALITRYLNSLYPALSLITVLDLFGDQFSLVTPIYGETKKLEGIRLGDHIIRTDDSGRVLIPFIGRNHTFPYYSATDVLHGKELEKVFAGKIVLVGTSALGLGDLHATSVDSFFPGVEVQATLLNGILKNNFSYKPAWVYSANISFTLIFGLLAALIFPFAGPRILSLVIFAFPLVLIFTNNYIWNKTGLVLSVFFPIIEVVLIALFNMIYGYLFETRRREELKKLFDQYVPEKHIDEMLASKSSVELHGENRIMSVLFADIRNFTEISEQMDATEVVKMLNDFFSPMTEIIFKNNGTIDKYVGDMIMAFWGAPIADTDHAQNALQSALEMQKKADELSSLLKDKNIAAIKIGIGINSGSMTVGDMGSYFRRNYTVIGDVVNLASRVENLTKFYGVDVIAAEATQADQTKFIFRKLDKVKVRGRKQYNIIYELIGKRGDLTESKARELELYHQALEYYYEQKWEDASQLFKDLLRQHPHVKLYQIYLDRINELSMKSLPDDWDGIFTHAEK